MFVNELGASWIPAIPAIHDRLNSAPARVADIGCGAGWSTIAIARAYPAVGVDGFDADPASVEAARQNAADAGVADRVRFHLADASEDITDGAYELVTIFEAVHDMARPVEALAAARRLAGDGPVLVADERVAESFSAPGDLTERLMYGFSVLHCLPVGREDADSAATGTVMRPDTLRRYAADAGFAGLEILPIDNDFWRFYLLSS
jgi:ubiquinone/menaquinone biosynthesis C-methylase UbiE